MVLAAAAAGEGTCSIAGRLGFKQQTVYSIVKAGR